jgi:gluconolactonase
MRILWLLLGALHLQFSPLLVRAASSSPVLRLDSAVDALVAADARLETLFQSDTIFDGATWVHHGGSGYLIFSDVPGNTIDKLNPDGSVSVFQNNIFAGKDPSQAYQSSGAGGQKKFWMLGAEGITLDRQGRIVYCAYSDGQIVRLEADGRRTILASRLGADRLNGPNDLVYKSDGALYFTDTRADTRRTDGEGVPHKGLYMLRAGEVQLLSKDIDHPNGVAFSPDEKYLYVSNTLLMNILRFDVQAGGITGVAVFFDMSDAKGVGAPDGIKVDRRGNVYCTGPGGVWIISSEGRHIGTILTPTRISNLAFGEEDARTLYLTSFGALYRIPLKVAGR